jgi:Zn-dependent protease
MVAAAGPLTNILLAVIFAIIVRVGVSYAFPQWLLIICVTAVYTNLVLALYNLIPIPPLDGSKVLKALLPIRGRMAFAEFERSAYALGPLGLVMVGLLAIYLLWPILSVAVQWVFTLLTGV